MNIIVVAYAILSVVALLMYTRDSLKKRDKAALVPLAISVVIALAVVFLLSEIVNETTIFFALDFAMLFAIMPYYYAVRTRKLIALLALIAFGFFYATYSYGSLLYPFIQMFAIGTMMGLLYKGGPTVLKKVARRDSKSLETRRDVVHVFLGAIIMLLFLSTTFYYAEYITTILIIIGYVYNSALAKYKGKGFSFLSKFERSDDLFGTGALYLGVGVLLLLGFVHTLHFMIIGIAALMFADPIATIVGLNLDGPKLFYNKKKSVYGTLAFMAVVLIVGYPFIGYYAALFAAILAFVESTESPIDDNIAIPLVMIIVYIIFLGSIGWLPFPV